MAAKVPIDFLAVVSKIAKFSYLISSLRARSIIPWY